MYCNHKCKVDHKVGMNMCKLVLAVRVFGAATPGTDPVFLGRWELCLWVSPWRRPCCDQQPAPRCTHATYVEKSSIEHITWRRISSLTLERGHSLVCSVRIVQHWRGMSPNTCRHAMLTGSPNQVPLVSWGESTYDRTSHYIWSMEAYHFPYNIAHNACIGNHGI